MLRRLLPVTIALSVGCAPQSAQLLGGEYYAFLSADTSFSLQKGAVDPADWGNEAWAIDCREFETNAEKQALQLEDALKMCGQWTEIGDFDDDPEPTQETWLGQSAWHILHEELDPWRGEAIITSEGDLQIGFHHRLPGGADFRFAFVVDPDFAPKRCEIDGGDAVPINGDWVENWSTDLKKIKKNHPGYEYMEPYIDNGQLWYLNEGSYQLNPSDLDGGDLWFFPEEFEAGTAAGKFSEEDFSSRASRYAENFIYEDLELFDYYYGTVSPRQEDLYYCDLDEGEDPTESECMLDLGIRTNEIADEIEANFDTVLVPYRPLVHENLWRVGDDQESGLDGWMEMHYGWVVIDGNIDVGEDIAGAFQIIMDGTDSNSRFLVRGNFEAKIKKDRWVLEDLRASKLEENGNSLCILE